MKEPFTERYQLMMESFLLGCGYKVRELLIKQGFYLKLLNLFKIHLLDILLLLPKKLKSVNQQKESIYSREK